MTEHKPWLSLPDEDPPERGLAELMAAARAKAEIMANPPWWKRFAELLRRPPVLALATVVVLIGGVIIVHREPAQMQAPVATPPAAGETPPAEPAGVGAMQPPPPPAEHRRQEIETKGIAGTNENTAESSEKKGISGKNGKAAESNADASKLARPDNAQVETGSVEVDLVPKQQVEVAPRADDQPGRPKQDAVKQPVQRDPTALDVAHTAVLKPRGGDSLAGKKASPGDSLARCRAAAANKDCAGARACAKQIETESPQFYKDNVANDATIKSCL